MRREAKIKVKIEKKKEEEEGGGGCLRETTS